MVDQRLKVGVGTFGGRRFPEVVHKKHVAILEFLHSVASGFYALAKSGIAGGLSEC